MLPFRARRPAPGAVPRSDAPIRHRAAGRIAVALSAFALLAGCGGAGDLQTAEPDTPAVEATLLAPVDDVDGLTVKGVELDTREARFVDDDGIDRPVEELDVGMTVEVDARIATDGSRGIARRVKSAAALQGPVDAIVGESAALALGTPIRTDASTSFEGVESLAALRPGDAIRVHGLAAPDGGILATRVERSAAPFTLLRLRGTVTALDPSVRQFTLGALRVSYDGAVVRGSLADGARVVVRSDRPPAEGRWTVTDVQVEPASRFPDGGSVAIEGLVSGFVSLADFRVGGVPVDGSRASVVGDPAALRDGVRVTVRGAWTGNRVDAASIGFIAADRPRTIVGVGPVFGTPLFWGPSYWGPGWFPWVPAGGFGPGPSVTRGPFSSSWLARPVPSRPPGPIPSGAGGAFSRPLPSAQPTLPSVQPTLPSVRPVPTPSVRPTPGGPRGGWMGGRGRGGARGR